MCGPSTVPIGKVVRWRLATLPDNSKINNKYSLISFKTYESNMRRLRLHKALSIMFSDASQIRCKGRYDHNTR